MAFQVRIKNFIANPVRVGIFGLNDSANFRVDLGAGETFSDPGVQFLGGHRMVVVWDNLAVGEHSIVVSQHINLQGETMLNVKPNKIEAFTPVEG